MTTNQELPWVPLLVPDMPSPQELLPWLERMHAVRHYSNFGPLVQELEKAFAQQFALESEQLTTVANATQGLELVLQALDLPTGSRILLPAFTFVATATAVVRAGHQPVLADVDAHTWMLTPEIARAACECMRIDAVLPVATFGMPHDMRAWQQFERDTGLAVVIDAAAAYGSQWLQGAEGTLVFSLHTTKSLPAGEGGLVVSTRPGLGAKVRQLSNFGINLDPGAAMPVGALADLGSNAKMSEYHAAIGLVSLQKWEQHAHKRRTLQADLIREICLASGHSLAWQAQGPAGPQMAPTLLCVQLPDAAARTTVERACQEARIMTRRWYQPLLQHMDVLQQQCLSLDTPNAVQLAQTLLGLPFFWGITLEQRQRICDVVARASAAACSLK
ncbi:DegT/DnrJ/EryC1/StrS aminotransferase family protein [Comamonas sp. Y6]|uniref:DegT/DnrJ/EryC1/StrS aminotransferase family protein n=1 Tax=Comamonas resistens TaxID=3046670 RepID=A0ABY8SU87_9BURK|nr:DegT/DnrJ/EryC1/StrS aminotransferase family protein [Comamonas resistens]MDL5038626.1 DegT/DnrJ/EryC1/StrS aminotransferase family protein [Comamonas resistens]WHS66005.1 DegT/DnrJ/EryC1/StrS aminotransferase family protein [Comamonas resistens]